ncbi:MAG: class I SAM-dependent methyltransferase [bacterium]|nr:class I SAM-dependent methyltransferase [bacterium]
MDRNEYDEEIRTGLNLVKSFIKRWPGLFTFLSYTIGTVLYGGLSAKKAMRLSAGSALPQNPVIINLGSGTRRYSDEIINVDIFPFKNVDVVADARVLPFRDNSVDMVISEFLLEHVPSPELVSQEISRIVKPGGYIYITVPFLHPYHGSPSDFKRWTWTALERDFSAFAPLRTGVRAGPMSALLTLLTYWLAILFSFRSKKLYLFFTQFFMVLLAPLKLFDVVFRIFPQSIEAADLLYFWGRKK